MKNKKGQGESLIKLLVVAIIAIIALAVAKSYFREASKKTQKTVEEIFSPEESSNSEKTITLPLLFPIFSAS